MEYISENKKMINSRIKSLLGESYIRGYELLIKNKDLNPIKISLKYILSAPTTLYGIPLDIDIFFIKLFDFFDKSCKKEEFVFIWP